MGNIILPQSTVTTTDIEHTPRLGWVFQLGREDFLYGGSARIDDGFTRDADGNVTSSYGLVQFYAFEDPDLSDVNVDIVPGEFGLQQITSFFTAGSVYISGVQTGTILFTTTPGSFQQWIDGKVSIVTSSANGALSAFAFWDDANGQVDPYDFYVESATDLFSGNVGGGWTRHNAIFVPHRRAKYLAVGAKVYNLPNTGTFRSQLFKKWMVEKASPEDVKPTAKYRQAREVVVKVRPDRINLSTNPGAEVDTTDWGVSAGSLVRSTAQARSGLASFAWTTAGAASISHEFEGKPSRQYTVSVFVRGSGQAQIRLLSDPGGVVTALGQPVVLNDVWTRLWVTGTFAASATSFFLSVLQLGGGAQVMNLDDALIERGAVLGDPFDGSTSADTSWETGGTTGKARSYLYKNRAARYAAIKRVLDDNVPLGIGIAEPEFAVLPADW